MKRCTGPILIIASLMPIFTQQLRGDELVDRVGQLTEQATPKVLEFRRDFHAHPELPNREQRTAQVVAERLRELGVDEIQTGVAHHGVVALIKGGKPGPTVALRADMDALPIQEQTGLAFASTNSGVMHACGHDVHSAVLLGAAEVLSKMRDDIPGNVNTLAGPGRRPGERSGNATRNGRRGFRPLRPRSARVFHIPRCPQRVDRRRPRRAHALLPGRRSRLAGWSSSDGDDGD